MQIEPPPQATHTLESVAIVGVCSHTRDIAEKLTQELGFNPSSVDCRWVLKVLPEHLELTDTQSKQNPFTLDFLAGKLAYRLRQSGKKQDIAKAFGLHKGRHPEILDATAGLGRDAIVLAALGCKVRMIERSPLLFAMLREALERANLNEEFHQHIGIHLTLEHNQSETQLASLASSQRATDAVYLDPMFSHPNPTAAAKKELMMMRELIGNDPDADQLLPLALTAAKQRVVVKRPSGSPFLNEQSPSYSLKGKSTRFDIYLCQPDFSN